MELGEDVTKFPVTSSLPVAGALEEEEEFPEGESISADTQKEKYPWTLLLGLLLVGIVLIPTTSIIGNEFSSWYMGRRHKDSRSATSRLLILLVCLLIALFIIYVLYTRTSLFVIPPSKPTKKSTKKSTKLLTVKPGTTTPTNDEKLPTAHPFIFGQ